jgi:hypothetical protein
LEEKILIKKYTEEYLISSLIKLSIKLEMNPTCNDSGKMDGVPDRSVFENRFGSWNRALIKSGLKINCYFRKWTKEKRVEKADFMP